MIRVRNLVKKFDKLTAVDDVSFAKMWSKR
jgi:hypothetical protein